MNTNNAETKPAKVGETLASNVEGNPELSLVVEESVETRRRVCILCGNDLPQRKSKFCSKVCSSRYHSYQHRVKNGLIQKPGVGSGGNQLGEYNHQYKNGIANFNLRALAHYGKKCNRCGSLDNIIVHHRDHNRNHNQIENLEVLCKRCHQEHHCNRDSLTGKYIKGWSRP